MKPPRRLLRLLLLLLLPLLLPALAACERPEEPVPPVPLLPKDQMVRLLTDLHVLEAQVDASRLNPDSARALFLARQRELLWRARTTDSVFQRSFRYYGVHRKDLEELYQAVLDTLDRRQRALAGADSSRTSQTAEAARRGLVR